MRRRNPGDEEWRRLERASGHDAAAAAAFLRSLERVEPWAREWRDRLNRLTTVPHIGTERAVALVRAAAELPNGLHNVVIQGERAGFGERNASSAYGHREYWWRIVGGKSDTPAGPPWGIMEGRPLLSFAIGTASPQDFPWDHPHGIAGFVTDPRIRPLADRWHGIPHVGAWSFAVPLPVAVAWATASASDDSVLLVARLRQALVAAIEDNDCDVTDVDFVLRLALEAAQACASRAEQSGYCDLERSLHGPEWGGQYTSISPSLYVVVRVRRNGDDVRVGFDALTFEQQNATRVTGVKNLRWILEHWQNIRQFVFIRPADHHHDAILLVLGEHPSRFVRDQERPPEPFVFASGYASEVVFRNFVKRPTFRGAPLVFVQNGVVAEEGAISATWPDERLGTRTNPGDEGRRERERQARIEAELGGGTGAEVARLRDAQRSGRLSPVAVEWAAVLGDDAAAAVADPERVRGWMPTTASHNLGVRWEVLRGIAAHHPEFTVALVEAWARSRHRIGEMVQANAEFPNVLDAALQDMRQAEAARGGYTNHGLAEWPRGRPEWVVAFRSLCRAAAELTPYHGYHARWTADAEENRRQRDDFVALLLGRTLP